MGYQTEAACRECGHAFTVDHGRGLFFILYRCDRCGRTRSVRTYAREKPPPAPGPCACGGSLGEDAPPRCPLCRSADLVESAPTILYD